MKKSKKFVLAGLALLAAITMVLLPLSGCKNDTVPETPKYTVTFNTDGGSTVASQTVESGQKAKEPAEPELEGSWFLGWYSDEGLAKKFDFNTPITTATTVYAKWSYKLHTEPSILTNYTSPNHTDSKRKYVEFGDWPQTIKAEGVYVDETKSKTMGMFTYYLGSDGNHYVKHSDKYYKVEPIVWRVLTEDYKDPDGNSTGNALLLAESILTGGVPYYVDTKTRPITGAGTKNGEADTVYPNNWEYSTIRAWLNGSYEEKDTQNKTYTGKGFLQTAFTQFARELIADTTVDNTAASTTDAGSTMPQATKYACANTTDKVFLLSEEEATTNEYGFAAFNAAGQGNTRIRVTTDYAKATGANQSSTGDWWWLRSPLFNHECIARDIYYDGYADDSDLVSNATGGVVPALSISLGGN